MMQVHNDIHETFQNQVTFSIENNVHIDENFNFNINKKNCMTNAHDEEAHYITLKTNN